ncbi:clathrin heavy chain 1-like [Lytechinus variegatus]|uniref:clathrin heavy chain 1-like n=1 Tax=Lytechinus variegatus TaxID=7654 RepID=UPI001BB21AC0|nr:clathrin heavy chain 1-like [Lytechinus variegatus]
MDRAGEGPLLSIQQVFQLSSYGVKSGQVTFPRVTASSHRWICCRHTSKKKKRDNCVTAINLTRRTPRALTWPCSADSAMMNPRKPWLALKAGKHFQIFNIVAEKQLYRCTMKDEVQYWSWLNDDVIGIVGSKFIYHWDLSPLGFSCPMKAFPRHGRLNFCQIVGYKADPSFRWFAVLGLYKDYEDGDSNSVSGVVQIYSATVDRSQCIDAQAINFASYRRSDNKSINSVLIIVNRQAGLQGKLHIIELGPHLDGNCSLTNHSEQVNFDDEERYDFPVSVQVSSSHGLVYILTKMGRLKLCDLETGTFLSSCRASHLTVFTCMPDTDGKRVLGISRCGRLLSMGVKEKALVSHVRTVLKRPAIADRLERTFSETL